MADPATIGKYRIDSVLGKGAMGVVYKAFDPGIERAVAIKTVRKDLVDPDLVEQSMARFKNEARAAGRLLHPNIVSVYEYGEDDDKAFIVMEYVEGTGLRDFLSRGAAFDLAQVAAIMTQLLLALDFAHERGVIHRDIKPANLILTESGTLKVADFGIARIDTSSLTSLGMVMGTPSYMSPEQCQGLAVDRRTDLFSAGVVFYELVAGEKPFSGALETIAYKICHEDPRPPSTVSRLALSPTIDAVISTALEKNPDARFQNAKALSRALRQACDALADVTDDPLGARRAAERTGDVDELYTLLAENISDPAHRQRFFDEGGATASATRSARQPGSTTGQRARVHAAALEQSFVDQTTMRLATYLGPIARVVANRAAQKASTQDEFVQLVADHLGAQDRGAFLREIGFDH